MYYVYCITFKDTHCISVSLCFCNTVHVTLYYCVVFTVSLSKILTSYQLQALYCMCCTKYVFYYALHCTVIWYDTAKGTRHRQSQKERLFSGTSSQDQWQVPANFVHSVQDDLFRPFQLHLGKIIWTMIALFSKK